MSFILNYSCSTAAGQGVEPLWERLVSGKTLAQRQSYFGWHKQPGAQYLACEWPHKNAVRENGSVCDFLAHELLRCWADINSQNVDLGPSINQQRLGVIFGSTKGCVEDYIWRADKKDILESDPYTPVLEQFLRLSHLRPSHKVCLSNACSSSHVALFLADQWLWAGVVDQVLVLAADYIGPFITNGFAALKALASHHQKPFAPDRDGLLLGDAALAIWLSTKPEGDAAIKLTGIHTLSEGFAATRPDAAGKTLQEVCQRALAGSIPDAIIAHGTATITNDAIEDKVFTEIAPHSTLVTGSKWCMGHTMAASGGLDVILGCEALRRQQLFTLALSPTIDPQMRAQYARSQDQIKQSKRIRNLLVSSLGFGGVHAAALLSTAESPRQKTVPAFIRAPSAIGLRCLFYEYLHDPTIAPPDWTQKLERWNQLDPAARALAQAFVHFKNELGKSTKILLLCNATGSNETDAAFTTSGAASPSRFVHTLPSVRASSLLQIWGETMPVVCVQAGEFSLASALAQIAHLIKNKTDTLYLFHLKALGDGHQRVTLVIAGDLGDRFEHAKLLRKDAQPTADESSQVAANDDTLLQWFLDLSVIDRPKPIGCGGGFEIIARRDSEFDTAH